MDTKKIGKSLEILRNNKKWSLEYVAKSVKTNRETMSTYEKDSDKMSIGMFNDLLHLHKMTLLYFFNNVYDNSLIDELQKQSIKERSD